MTDSRRATGPLDGIELAIFDKDGTLIDFHHMWSGWVGDLGAQLAAALDDRGIDEVVFRTMGVDRATGRVLPHGALAATPMARLREDLVVAVVGHGVRAVDAEAAIGAAWHAPDPLSLARPVTDLVELFGRLRAAGTRIAVATSDDRDPTERTLRHLGIAGLIDGLACADDGELVKPQPHAVRRLCREIGVPAARTAVIGDSPLDLAMGRAAGVGLVIGVLTGVADRAALAGSADLVVGSVAELLPA